MTALLPASNTRLRATHHEKTHCMLSHCHFLAHAIATNRLIGGLKRHFAASIARPPSSSSERERFFPGGGCGQGIFIKKANFNEQICGNETDTFAFISHCVSCHACS
ncbi:hypothetical protein [Janthinobacterium sp. UMAB-60]|uniref:hypothetical protein n=1 Tax=Janthinobacterium sp. UMAB-60 TaxID=1365365 RepID=UPI001C56B37F|nr:hypothetical protein [Janthinobacterium sp. UMAB-60]